MSIFDEMALDELIEQRAEVKRLLAMRTPEQDPIGCLQYADLLEYIEERIRTLSNAKRAER